MTKTIGVFTDTHANLPALLAITDYFHEHGITELYHLGDIITIGAYPAECMRFFADSNITCLLGNHDNGYLKHDSYQAPLSKISSAHKLYNYEVLGEEYKNYVQTFPLVLVKEFFGLRIAFMHYAINETVTTNDRFWRPITNNVTPETMDDYFKNIPADLILYGHRHSPSDVVGQRRYVNLGSLGCYRGTEARGALVRIEENADYEIEYISVPYDKKKLFDEMDRRDIPDKDFIMQNCFGGK